MPNALPWTQSTRGWQQKIKINHKAMWSFHHEKIIHISQSGTHPKSSLWLKKLALYLNLHASAFPADRIANMHNAVCTPEINVITFQPLSTTTSENVISHPMVNVEGIGIWHTQPIEELKLTASKDPVQDGDSLLIFHFDIKYPGKTWRANSAGTIILLCHLRSPWCLRSLALQNIIASLAPR